MQRSCANNRPFPSSPVPVSKRVYVRNLSYENEFCMQFHFLANQSHFHKNGFALRLALKQRHKGTRKWPISSFVLSVFMSDLTTKWLQYINAQKMTIKSNHSYTALPSSARPQAAISPLSDFQLKKMGLCVQDWNMLS